jgi:hypothetical protein
MTEEVKEEKLSMEIVQFNGGLYVPLRNLIKLFNELTNQQSAGFKLLTDTIRAMNAEATNLLKKDQE